MSENAIIGFPDWSDTITWTDGGAFSSGFTAGFPSPGSFESAYPASNMGSAQMAAVARTTDATTTSSYAVGELASEELVDLVALVLPNASSVARARITLDGPTGAELDRSPWFDVFPEVYPVDDLLWEDKHFWFGKYSDDELDGYLWTRPHQFDQAHLAKYIHLELDDTSNADGYIDVAYVAVAQAWQLAVNPSPDSGFGFSRARTRSQTARGGAKNFDRLPKPNSWRGTVEMAGRDEAFTQAFESMRQMDIDKPFLWWPHPGEPKHWLRNTYIARWRELSRLRYAGAPMQHTEYPIDLEQVL